jgi:hypothetical protein
MKDSFEAAAIKAMDKVLSRSIITGCKFHFGQCLWRQPQNGGIQGSKQVRLTGRMRAVLAYLPISTAEQNMLLNMKILHRN